MPLMTTIERLCRAQPFQTHLYVKDLRSGNEYGWQDRTVIKSGSTRKVVILMAALREVARGQLSLEMPFTLDAHYQQLASRDREPGQVMFNKTPGAFQNFRPGSTITLFDALTMMIIVSDNTCTGKIVDMLGLDSLNDLCRSIGMEGTTLRWNVTPDRRPREASQANATTARDMGLLLDLIVRGADDPAAAMQLGTTTELCRVALKMLSWQIIQTLLPGRLPKRANIAHKTGTPPDGDSFNDVGIVYDGQQPRFVITYYSAGVPIATPDGLPGQLAAGTHAAQLCRLCWDELVADERPV